MKLSQLLGCPLFGSNSGLFSSRFYCLTCGNLKKKERRKGEEIKREKLRRNKTIKKKIIKKIKNYFKNRKSFLLASNWPSHFCWSPLQQVGRFRDSLSLGFQFGLKALLVCTLPPAGASGVGKGPSAPLWECCTARWGGGQSGCCRRVPQTA